MKNSGKVLLTAAAAGISFVAACLKRSQYEREHFVTEEITLQSKKIKKPYTLVFLSDIHDKEFGTDGKALFDAIEQIRPDAVLIGGDTMVAKEGKASLTVTRRLLHGLSSLPNPNGTGHCPVYYGNGNHEQRLNEEREHYGTLYEELLELFKQEGIHYLSDSSGWLGEDICISGLNLEHGHYRNVIPKPLSPVSIGARLGKPDSGKYQILLAHSPLFYQSYAAWGADLTLCGHFHGGTIRLPFLGGVMTPQFQFFLPCCAGTIETEGRFMAVSRGLGTHSINIRLNNRPQLLVIHLKPE